MQFSLVNKSGKETITVLTSEGQIETADDRHPCFREIVAAVLNGDEKAIELFDATKVVNEKFEKLTDKISVANGTVFYNGDPVDNSITRQIIRFCNDGLDNWRPLALYTEKVYQNICEHSREMLTGWLAGKDITITTDGNLIAYKGIGSDMLSVFGGKAIVDGVVVEGKIPNQVGSVIEMPRSEVTHEPSSACSVGLHVSTLNFAENYGNTRIAVVVDPRDVVSVPSGEGVEKMRVCRYRVKEIISQVYTTAVVDDLWLEDEWEDEELEPENYEEDDWEV